MARKRYSAEQINGMLREAEIQLASGKTTGEISRMLGIAERTYYRWRKAYGGMKVDQAKRLKEVIGYRAASFSINATNLWALEELEASGHRYSSSIYPVRHDIYGMPDAPRFAFFPATTEKLIEWPGPTLDIGGHRWACGGGGYFRILPYALFRWAVRRIHARDRQPSIFYFHPWEIDPLQPRVDGLGLKSRLRHYTNLGRTEARLRQLLTDFRWDRFDTLLGLRDG